MRRVSTSAVLRQKDRSSSRSATTAGGGVTRPAFSGRHWCLDSIFARMRTR